MDRSLLRAVLVCLALCAPGCPLYAPTIVDCSVHCSAEGSTCPVGTTCRNTWCRLPKAESACECKAGDERACGGSRGECVPGIQRCVQGTWSTVCLGEGHATQESCDGRDNDCDGNIDNDVTDAPACTLTRGVCAAAKQECAAGIYMPCTVASYGADYEAIETRCDSLDNDCDGNVDSTATLTLATADGDFALIGYDGGYALVYTAGDGGATLDLYVARLDRALVRQSTKLVTTGLAAPALSAAGLNRDVFVVWQQGSRLGAAKVPEVLPVELFGALADSGYSDTTLMAAVSSQKLIAAFRAESEQAARFVTWSTSGGAPTIVDVNRDGGGYFTDTVYGVNVARGGEYAAMNSDVLPPDGGSSTDYYYPIYSTSTWQPVATGQYTGSRGSALVQAGAALTSTYMYSVFYNWPPFSQNYSGIYFIPDLLAPSAEITVAEAPDFSVYGSVDAVARGSGIVMVYMNKQLNQLIMATSYRSGSSTLFRTRGIDPAAGFGVPHLAAAGGDFLGLAWSTNGQVFGRRVCAP